jgi:hypothetical protein
MVPELLDAFREYDILNKTVSRQRCGSGTGCQKHGGSGSMFFLLV